jgi:hypothetical protein
MSERAVMQWRVLQLPSRTLSICGKFLQIKRLEHLIPQADRIFLALLRQFDNPLGEGEDRWIGGLRQSQRELAIFKCSRNRRHVIRRERSMLHQVRDRH